MPKISDEQRAASRRRLIDATVAVAERDGIDALTTRAIVAEAGVSAGMFYGHFSSKEDLLAAVVDQKVDEFTTLLDAALALGEPVADVARELLRHLLLIRDLEVLATFRSAPVTDDSAETQRAINQRIVDAFEPLVAAAVEAGVIRPDIDAHAVVEVIDILVMGINRRAADRGFVTSRARIGGVVIAALEAILLTPQGQRPGEGP